MRDLVFKKNNKRIRPLGMGCWAIGGPFKSPDGRYFGYGKVNDEESVKTVEKAIELGINFFDTADVYGTGHSERILGKVLPEHREEIVVATKFGSMFEEYTRNILDKHTSSPEYIRTAVQDSCRRLQTDYIDLYQFHWWECPFDEGIKVRETLEDLVSEGIIHGYGWSTDDVKRADLFAQGENCTAMQYILNLTTNNPEMINLCEEKDLLSVIRSPLGYGLLTGKYSKAYQLPNDHWLKGVNLDKGYFANMKNFVTTVEELITEDGRTLAQAAIGYIWALSDSTLPIPGAKNEDQLVENTTALEFGPLKRETVIYVQEEFNKFKNLIKT